MSKKYRDVKKALRHAGWVRLRTKGSHEIWGHPNGRRVAIPRGKGNREVPVGTLASIRRDTGLEDLR
jgi:predicted RNA binding protein YcfA (HicA-like mRNA interferase family)